MKGISLCLSSSNMSLLKKHQSININMILLTIMYSTQWTLQTYTNTQTTVKVPQQQIIFTCGCSGHNSECSHGFSTNVVAIEQEAGQVLHVVKLTTQDLLGPLAHQTAGCRSHFVFSTRGLARRLHQLTLQSDKKTTAGGWASDHCKSLTWHLLCVCFFCFQYNLPHHQISADPGWVRMACEQKLSSLTRYNSMWEGVKAFET